jgi:signal transduction histidine kinase
LSNAVKYTERGFVSLTVTGITREDTVNLTIKIADSGRGIKREDMKKMFGEYVQFDLADNAGIEGTGLGLSITHGFVKAMGGNISVDSEYGKGSIFTVTLPQKIRGNEKLASVVAPQDKSVLL